MSKRESRGRRRAGRADMMMGLGLGLVAPVRGDEVGRSWGSEWVSWVGVEGG